MKKNNNYIQRRTGAAAALTRQMRLAQPLMNSVVAQENVNGRLLQVQIQPIGCDDEGSASYGLKLAEELPFSSSEQWTYKMKSINTQSVSISITQSSPDSRSTNGILYGSGHMAIIFSNMDTNDQSEWDAIISDLVSDRYMILTYDYSQHMDDQSRALEDALSFVCDLGAKKIILIGASRGGVASIKVAARHIKNDCIAGVVALSAPIEYEGTVFYRKDELNGIKIPKLLINSEHDDGANDTRKMFEIFDDPKELLLYQGDAHGTELFDKERESIIKKLQGFIVAAFETCG